MININGINTSDVRAFVAVAKEKSFTKAAKALGVTKGAVSKAVMRLEKALGANLFIRTTRTVEMTDAGGACLEVSHQLLQTTSVLVSTAKRHRT